MLFCTVLPTTAHPAGGASRIYSRAGTDATEAFNAQHGPGSMQEGMLAAYLIGDLVA